MSKTSPSDLAAAFRSFPRRLQDALSALEPDPEARAGATGHADRLAAAVAAAAAAVGVPAGADVAASAAALAARIDATGAEQWDEATLDRLRALALDAGAALRAIDALAP